MTGGGQDQADTKVGQGETDLRRLFAGRNHHQHKIKQDSRIRNLESINSSFEHEENEEDEDEEDDNDSLSEALLAVSSAEEYAAKIIKLQQSCLTPLKEDLADWLNKIMNVSNITTGNFMDKLDNGVIICKLAKIISLWCEQQLATNSSVIAHQLNPKTPNRTGSQQKLNDLTQSHNSHSSYPTSKLSISTMDVSTDLRTLSISFNASLFILRSTLRANLNWRLMVFALAYVVHL